MSLKFTMGGEPRCENKMYGTTVAGLKYLVLKANM